MAYRRTERVVSRLAARREAILAAAAAAAAESGIAAVQIAAVAQRAGIAAGTVYRYFPSKVALIGELVEHAGTREIEAMRQAAQAAPGPLSAIAAAIAAFSSRALASRRLSAALLADAAGAGADAAPYRFRNALVAELERLIGNAAAAGLLPAAGNASLAAAALAGALTQSLFGARASAVVADPARREAVQSMTLLALRALGIPDARARGLVVQTRLPSLDEGAPRAALSATAASAPSST
jgi:AcrR family transcriptional regulator